MHKSLLDHIHNHLQLSTHALTYGDGMTGSRRLKTNMARFLTEHLQPTNPIEATHITVTNGCSSAIEHLSWALANPGEGFLLGKPYYGSFIPDICFRTGIEVVPVSFGDTDPFSASAVNNYEEELLNARAHGKKIAGLILCHPHNPLGRSYPREVLIGLMKLCQKYQIHLVCDEIYALSVWHNRIDASPTPVPFQSWLSIDSADFTDRSLIHVVWGMSKDFAANGIRVGAIVSQNNIALHTALIPVALFTSSSSISDRITANILEDSVWIDQYLTSNRKKLAEHYEIAVHWAKTNDIPHMPGVNAAFFLWVNLGRAYQERHPSEMILDIDEVLIEALKRREVFLASGRQFGSEQPGWFRIVFSNEQDYLLEGLDRVVRALLDAH